MCSKICIRRNALERGRAVIFPSGSPEVVPSIQLLAGPLKTHHHGQGDTAVSAFREKHYLGTVGSQQHSSLFVSQMLTDLKSPVDVVAFDLILDYIIAIRNGEVSGQIGQSSAGATRRSSTRGGTNRSGEEAAYSADLSGDVMKALSSSDGIDEFLAIRQPGLGEKVREAARGRRATLTIQQVISDLMGPSQSRRRLATRGAPGTDETDDNSVLAEATCARFREMLKNLWFSATIQLSRMSYSAMDCALHTGELDMPHPDEDRRDRLVSAAGCIAETLKAYVRPPKTAGADMYVVPSVGMELVMECWDPHRTEWVPHTEPSGYFPEEQGSDGQQNIRLHVTREKLEEVRDALRRPRGEDAERQPDGHFILNSTWGNSSGPGPSGAKFSLHEHADLNQLGYDRYGIVEVLRPQAIQTRGVEQQVPEEGVLPARPQGGRGEASQGDHDEETESEGEDGPGQEENTQPRGKYAPILSVYETYNRSFDDRSMFKHKQVECKKSLARLAVPPLDETKNVLYRTLADYVGAFVRMQLLDWIYILYICCLVTTPLSCFFHVLLQDKTIEDFLVRQPKPTPLRFEDVSVLHYKCGANMNGEDRDERDRSFVEAVREHILGRLSKLASVKFSELLSYSHHDEYPSLVRSLKGWMEVLSLRAYSEISHHGHCSYQVVDSMALCTGTGTLVFYSLDRKIPKELPLAAHLRSSAGKAITDCYKTSGYLVLPPHLLFGVWENSSRVGRVVGTHDLLGASSSFILKDYMYLLTRRLRNADDGELTQFRKNLFSLSRYVVSYFVLVTSLAFLLVLSSPYLIAMSLFVECRHMVTEILQFCRPSALPLVLLQYLSLTFLEDLVRNFEFSVRVKAKSRHKRFVWQLNKYEILEIRHERTGTELDMSPPIIGPSCAGSGFGVVVIFDDNNFRKIMSCLRQCYLKTDDSASGQQERFVTIETVESTGPQGVVKALVERSRVHTSTYNRTLLLAFTRCLLDYLSVIAPTLTSGQSSQGQGRVNNTAHQQTFLKAMLGPTADGVLGSQRRWGMDFLESLWRVVLHKAKPSHLPEFLQVETRKMKWALHPFNRKPSDPSPGDALLKLKNVDNLFTKNYAQYQLGFSDDISDHEKRRISRAQEQYVLDLLDTHVSTYLYALSKTVLGRIEFQIPEEEEEEENQEE